MTDGESENENTTYSETTVKQIAANETNPLLAFLSKCENNLQSLSPMRPQSTDCSHQDRTYNTYNT